MNIKTRDNNIELLRLICMWFILIHHMICHGLFSVSNILTGEGAISLVGAFATVINAFCYIGVNVFILISGYYSIKIKSIGLLNLYITCVFYAFLHFMITDISPPPGGTIKNVLLVFSHQDYWWFIRCYIILYLCSPLLNKGLQNATDKEYNNIVILFSILNLYFGYFWGIYAGNGYSVAHFIYLYIIGHGIFRYKDTIFSLNRNYYLCAYVVLSIIFGIICIINHFWCIAHWNGFSYNNPLLVISGISFFIYMLSSHYKNKYINYIAKSVLAIYLIQDIQWFRSIGEYFWQEISYFSLNNFQSVVVLLIFLLVFAIVFTIIVVIIDQIRIFINHLITNLYQSISKFV